jgi:hypothetical protein
MGSNVRQSARGERGAVMMEFLSSYGLWIVLAVIMIGMHWFGMGCCGGGHRQGSNPGPKGLGAQSPGGEKSSETSPKSGGCCH